MCSDPWVLCFPIDVRARPQVQPQVIVAGGGAPQQQVMMQ